MKKKNVKIHDKLVAELHKMYLHVVSLVQTISSTFRVSYIGQILIYTSYFLYTVDLFTPKTY